MIGWSLLILLAAFIAVILTRTLAFKPLPEKAVPGAPVEIDQDKAARNMQAMIRVKTVSYLEKSLEDAVAFEEFPAMLCKLYPQLHEKLTQERVGERGLLYRWPGKHSGKPAVLMAHYDVVPVQEDAWEKPPFSGEIDNGVLWGRGSLDTKCTLLGVMEAVEQLIAQGFVPENDLYLAFGGDEEIFGLGAQGIAARLQEKGVVPAFVLDEGGAVVDHVFPGVKERCALIGLGEKGILNIVLEAASSGGHASTPPPHTAVGIVARAVTRVEGHPFPFRLTPPVARMFDTLGRRSNFLFRMIFANLWCFKPLLNRLCKAKGGELNAMVRTTCAFTQMSGSPAFNVLPPKAEAGANLRLIGGETTQSARGYVEKAVGDSRVAVNIVDGNGPSPCSQAQGEAWERLKTAISQTWTDAVVSPYLMMAGSDSRHYAALSEHVYRFSPLHLTAEERRTIHAHNERIPLEKLYDLVRFYTRLIKLL